MSWLHARSTIGIGCLAPLQLDGISKPPMSICRYVLLSSTGRLLVPECGSAACPDHARVRFALGPQLWYHPQVASRQFYAILKRSQVPIPSHEPHIPLWSPRGHDRMAALQPSVSPSPWQRVWMGMEHLPLQARVKNNPHPGQRDNAPELISASA